MRVLFLFLLALASAGPASAVSDPTPDLLGLYFDETADLFCLEYAPPYTLLVMYAVYTNPTVTAIHGFDFGCEEPSNLLRLSVEIPGQPFWDPIEGYPYVVGFEEPRSVDQANVLVIFNFLILGTEPTYLQITGAVDAPYPDLSPSVWLPDGQVMTVPVRGGADGPTAALNTDCVVGNSPTTWDRLKSVYR